jgi:hypothetical protein
MLYFVAKDFADAIALSILGQKDYARLARWSHYNHNSS